jgi:hypothetical protein
LLLWVCLWLCGAIAASAQQSGDKVVGEQYIGTWSGTWEGAGGSGGFELTIEKATDGTLGGRVSVTGEPTYKATLKSLSFDGAKMSARYDFPPDPSLEVTLAAAFDDANAKGTWTVQRDGESIAGTWTVSRR